MKNGPRIYNLFPPLVGSIEAWSRHLPRIAAMGFDWVFLNPFHLPGMSGSLYSVRDYYRLNPLFDDGPPADVDRRLAAFTAEAERHGLSVMMDLVINHTAIDHPWVAERAQWYVRGEDGKVRSPFAVDPDDPSKVTVWRDLAEIDYAERPERDAIVEEWCRLVRHYASLGFGGFRCDAAYKVPAAVWAAVAAAARAVRPDAVLAAETLGCRLDEVAALDGGGFNFLFNSSRWWDFRRSWLLDQYEQFRTIAPSIAFPDSHDTPRLAAELQSQGITDPATLQAICAQRYLFAATFSTGVMMPIGFEYGFTRHLHVVSTRPADWEEPVFDLSPFIAEVNAMKAAEPALNEEGPQYRLYAAAADAAVLVRQAAEGGCRVVTAINPWPDRYQAVDLSAVPGIAEADGAVRDITPGPPPADAPRPPYGLVDVAPNGARVFAIPASAVGPERSAGGGVARIDRTALSARPIIIQNVSPEIDGGRYPIKREVGDDLEVRAEIFTDGHVKVAAVLKLREAGADDWTETPMQVVNAGLDRWVGRLRLTRNGRAAYTVEAWVDAFATWRDELAKKREAGQDVTLELAEGRVLVEGARERARGADRTALENRLAAFDAAPDARARAEVMMGDDLNALMARWPEREPCVVYRTLEVVVDRVQARFAAWYEMFPRSQGTVQGRGATFADCERRLPEIRDMGFDVVYFVPIHPIGRVHRKGPNNTLVAGPHDPGSPYAIGSAEGGHDAVHPELGTLDDFRHFVGRCREMGMEVALDFAIQCAPDHPWIEEHPEWFNFRPDGTIKYAENPPKKYQDIVNVDFHCVERDALWTALRDVVEFWARQGVRIFRVDNPHTKPVPFWEWMIKDIQSRHPDVLFLAEAFTRPPMLKMLAKAGFSQSYTYFTWRHTKHELTEYMNELTRSEVREYLRPNFFPNTPDILPTFLQTGGRPAFMIRFVLASTLSSVYGIYNGFELCENAAIPGREEYNNSEKYDYKVWDWNRPGNIKDYIKRINRLRRENPALQELDNLTFCAASHDDVLFYGKMTADRRNMVFVAVNLNPFDVREADVEFPLGELGVGTDGGFEVEDLLSGERHRWWGAWQHLRLDPHWNPAAIFRVRPCEHVDYRAPCL
ncbi:MAG: DUF3416 domain-containing protein [Rhodospirillales bacterium]|jgi:starch synthase (maltosyl-transferring)|nr:DUF3416 domain-containing protein [Rhodospirillales bacterium]